MLRLIGGANNGTVLHVNSPSRRPGLLASAVLASAGLSREDRYAAFRSAQHFHGTLLAEVLSPQTRAIASESPHAIHVALLRESHGSFFSLLSLIHI